MPTSTSEGEILTIKQVAEYLKVTERDDLPVGCSEEDPRLQGWRDMALSSAGYRELDQATVQCVSEKFWCTRVGKMTGTRVVVRLGGPTGGCFKAKPDDILS